MSEFREASPESLLITGTPSVRNLKFECGQSMCWKSQSLRTVAGFEKVLCIHVLVLELPTQWIKALSFLDFAMLTRDYRECSRYSRNSVGTPELEMSNTFVKLFQANFENVLKIRYNDARLR